MVAEENTYLLEKARTYCNYQERCMDEVKQKLIQWKASEKTIEKIIRTLENEDLINEERYAVAFALGKLRNNKWGKNKIFYALTLKKLPQIYIELGLNEIDEQEYITILKRMLKKKNITDSNELRKKQKLVKFAVQKGFSSSLAWKVVNAEI